MELYDCMIPIALSVLLLLMLFCLFVVVILSLAMIFLYNQTNYTNDDNFIIGNSIIYIAIIFLFFRTNFFFLQFRLHNIISISIKPK